VKIPVERSALSKNDQLAAELRAEFVRSGLAVVNLMSSPGSGKTSLLELNADANGDGDYSDAADLDQDRTHNDANETTALTEGGGQTAWPDPVWSARGNATTIAKPTSPANSYTGAYDSWNMLREVKSGEFIVAKFEYDGLNRRVKKHFDSQPPGNPDRIDKYRHYFYNAAWQLIETRVTTTEADAPDSLDPEYQYVWSLRYIDAPILRDENKNSDGDCTDAGVDERLYYLTDANFNVTCLTDTGGDALERYMYDPYGEPTVIEADWSADGEGVSDYANEILFQGRSRDPETAFGIVPNCPLIASSLTRTVLPLKLAHGDRERPPIPRPPGPKRLQRNRLEYRVASGTIEAVRKAA